MRTFKHAIALGAVVVGLLSGSAAAQAATQIDPTGPWGATAGPTNVQIGGVIINCAITNSTGNLAVPVPAGGNMAVTHTFAGCTGPGGVAVTHTCGPWSFVPGAFPTPTTVTGQWVIPAGSCTITLPGCTITYPSPGPFTSAAGSVTLDTTAQTLTWAAMGIPYTAAGPGCAGLGIPVAGVLTIGSAAVPPGPVTEFRNAGAPWTTS